MFAARSWNPWPDTQNRRSKSDRLLETKEVRSAQPKYALPGLLIVQALLWGIYYAVTGSLFAYFFLWVLPLMTIPAVINRLRTTVEHFPGFIGGEVNRATITGCIEYYCIASYGYSYHLEHHLIPEIPYYQLEWSHKRLEELGVDFTKEHLARRGYLRTFWTLLQQVGAHEPSAG